MIGGESLGIGEMEVSRATVLIQFLSWFFKPLSFGFILFAQIFSEPYDDCPRCDDAEISDRRPRVVG